MGGADLAEPLDLGDDSAALDPRVDDGVAVVDLGALGPRPLDEGRVEVDPPGDRGEGAKLESDLPAPLSPYAAAKIAGELYCQAFWNSFGFEAVALRYFNVFGPRQDPHSQYSAVIPLFITAMLSGRRPVIFGDGLQSRDFSFVENIVHANLLAADAPDVAGLTINVADGRSVDLLKLIELLNRLLGTDVDEVESQMWSTAARSIQALAKGRAAFLGTMLTDHDRSLRAVLESKPNCVFDRRTGLRKAIADLWGALEQADCLTDAQRPIASWWLTEADSPGGSAHAAQRGQQRP